MGARGGAAAGGLIVGEKGGVAQTALCLVSSVGTISSRSSRKPWLRRSEGRAVSWSSPASGDREDEARDRAGAAGAAASGARCFRVVPARRSTPTCRFPGDRQLSLRARRRACRYPPRLGNSGAGAALSPALVGPGCPPSRATQASRSCASSRRLSRCSIAAEDHELLLAVEDVHRADASTRELLDHLARRLAGLAALVLITYRSDELHRSHPFPPCNRGHSGLGRPRLPHRRAPSPRGRRA